MRKNHEPESGEDHEENEDHKTVEAGRSDEADEESEEDEVIYFDLPDFSDRRYSGLLTED